MRRFFFSAVCAAALAGGGVSLLLAADKPADKPKTQVQGELIDTYCYTAGGATGQDHKGCGQKCAKSGIPVGVLADGKAWTLATNPKPLAQYMAQTIRVTGEANKDNGVIIPDKVEVKDGDQWKEVSLSDAHHGGSEQNEFKDK